MYSGMIEGMMKKRIEKYKAIVGKLVSGKPMDKEDTGFLLKEKVIFGAMRPGWGRNAYYGKWRIIKMSEWDKDYCDMEFPAFIEIKKGGSGEFQFGLVSASLYGELKDAHEGRFFDFTWEGNDENDEATGDGWMKLKENGTAEGEIRFHGGDKSLFWAKRKKEERTK